MQPPFTCILFSRRGRRRRGFISPPTLSQICLRPAAGNRPVRLRSFSTFLLGGLSFPLSVTGPMFVPRRRSRRSLSLRPESIRPRRHGCAPPPMHASLMDCRSLPTALLLSSLLPGGWPMPVVSSPPSYPRGDGMPVRWTQGDGASASRPGGRAVEVVPSDDDRSFDEKVDRLQPDERTLFEQLGRGHTLRNIAAAQKQSRAAIGRLHRRLLQRLDLDTPLALRRRAVRWCRRTASPVRGNLSSRID